MAIKKLKNRLQPVKATTPTAKQATPTKQKPVGKTPLLNPKELANLEGKYTVLARKIVDGKPRLVVLIVEGVEASTLP